MQQRIGRGNFYTLEQAIESLWPGQELEWILTKPLTEEQLKFLGYQAEIISATVGSINVVVRKSASKPRMPVGLR